MESDQQYSLDIPYVQKDHLEYPQLTMFQMVERIGKQYPDEPAYEFYGKKTTYRSFLQKIEQAARAFYAAGIRRGDAVTICLPNIPQALVCFYALNRIGAVSNMVHPLSARNEIIFYLNISESRMILTVDMFYEKVAQACAAADHPVTILAARMQDELPPVLAVGFWFKEGKKYTRFPNRTAQQVMQCAGTAQDHEGKAFSGEILPDMLWKNFLKKGTSDVKLPENVFDKNHTSVILYSGGTTGTSKGICLSDLNFNALAMQAREAIGVEFQPGLSILSCMPCFHGFGLGINLHTTLVHGVRCILMPSFTIKTYADMLIKKHPTFIAGVPTIFEALLHMPQLEGKDLSFLSGMFCGGDSLSVELKKKIDEFLRDHGSRIQIREGYGLTECVTASCLTPRDSYKAGSIGIPFPDTQYRIVRPGTDEVVPFGEEGEIILSGPTVMIGYLKNPEETADTLRPDADGKIWLHTGDLGTMDEDGYVFFRQRIKRMIITNGYNVYPGQIENVIDSCPDVAYSCVIGVPDPHRMQRVRAYVVLRDGVEPDDACRERIMEELKLHVAGYALPKEIFFREALPKTLVGKVAYRKLEEEAVEESA